MTNNWYEENIEEPVRDIVKHLRDNGFNTECSCGHEMYIQCQLVLDGEMQRLHDLLYSYMYDNKLPVNYQISVIINVNDGHMNTSINIVFKDNICIK